MRCAKCSSIDDKVIETRISREGDFIRRRRQCLNCGYRFTTYESIVPTDVYVVKRDGRREEFKPDKLREGIRSACWKRSVTEEDIDKLVQTIGEKIGQMPNGEISSQVIGELVMEGLRRMDEVAYVRFASVYRHFKDADAFIDAVQDLPSKQPDSEQGTEKRAQSIRREES